MAETVRRVTIAGHRFDLRASDVTGAMESVDPEPIARHYVVIGPRRFPPKQVISAVTGLDRADFTSHQARRTLMRLGFSAGRRGAHASPGPPHVAATDSEPLADRLRPLAGQWVALRRDEILHTADTPQRLVGWLTANGQAADSMFRVPEDESSATGLAPL